MFCRTSPIASAFTLALFPAASFSLRFVGYNFIMRSSFAIIGDGLNDFSLTVLDGLAFEMIYGKRNALFRL